MKYRFKRIRKRRILKKINNIEEKMRRMDERYLAGMSYVWIFFLVPWLLQKKSKFCEHHIKQGMVLFFFSIVATMFGVLPLVGRSLELVLWTVIVFLSLRGVYACLKKEKWRIPVLGQKIKSIKIF